MKIKQIFYSLCLAIMVMACAIEPLATEANETLLQTDFKGFNNAPEQSGMFVVRTEDYFAFGLIDSKTQLTTINGYDISFCNGEPFIPAIVSAQIIDIPNEDLRTIALLKDEVSTTVFEGAWDFESDICEFLNNATVLAQGETQLIWTDNDYFVSDSNNVNAFGFRLGGRLLSPENEIQNLNAMIRFVYDKEGDLGFDLREYQLGISVQLH